jgi:glycerol-3-phosphate dehydrogenase
MPAPLLEALRHRHGTRTPRVLGEARSAADLGTHFGETLYAAEIDYCMREEWARDGEDLLWRRTKCGLHLDAAQRDAVAEYMRSRAR